MNGVAVKVEVTDRTIRTSTGKEKQLVYVDLGDKYPVQKDIWINDGKALPSGVYVCRSLRETRFGVELDLNQLEPAKAA